MLVNRISNKIKKYTREVKKHTFHLGKQYDDQRLIFIMGCQRSGTSITSDIFNLNPNIKVFNEMKSVITSQDKHSIRLNDDDNLKETFSKYNFPILLAKPLVESQNCQHYLSVFPNLKVLWLYRHYRDVAKSNIAHFGEKNGFKNLRLLIDGEVTDWRRDKIDQSTVKMIEEYMTAGISNLEAAALMWYIRNRFYITQHLQDEKRVLLFKYEDIVKYPDAAFERMYEFIGTAKPSESYRNKIYKKAVGKGEQIPIRRDIEELCEELYQQLETIYKKTNSIAA